MNKKRLLIFSSLLIVAGLAGWLAQEKIQEKPVEIEWAIAHAPVKYFKTAAENLGDQVEKATNGAVQVKIKTDFSEYDFAQSAKAPSAFNHRLLEEVQSGRLDMAQLYTPQLAEQLEPEFFVLDLPYLFEDDAHLTRFVESAAGEELLAQLEAHNLKGLGITYSGGMKTVATIDKEIRSLEDFKGLRYRAFLHPINVKMMKILGVDYLPPNFKDRQVGLAEMLKQGAVIGGDATYADAGDAFDPKLAGKNTATVLNLPEHEIYTTVLVMNLDKFQSLSRSQQKALKEAAVKTARAERKHIIEDGKRVLKEAKAAGIKIVKWNQKEKQRLRNKVQPIYDEYVPKIGEELVNKVRTMRDQKDQLVAEVKEE